MAMSTTTSKKSLSHIPLVAIIITIHLMPLLLHRVNSQDSLSFSFNGFYNDSYYSSIILQGDASYSKTSPAALQLTKLDEHGYPARYSCGRALYSCPVRLYDNSTGRVSSIHTSFVLDISVPFTSIPADGLTFFFAPVNYNFSAASCGGFLGLFPQFPNNSRNEVIGFRDSRDEVVAVEFDTYPNDWDPKYKHIGIDVNSTVSVATAQWDWENWKNLTVKVSYNPHKKMLRVNASYPDGSHVDFILEIDLTAYLPEWVQVGFSASTGANSQVNNVISWAYSSDLVDVTAVGEKGGIASVV